MRLLGFCLLFVPAAGVLAQSPANITEIATKYKSGKEWVRAVQMCPAGAGPFPAVVVVHGDFGPNAWVKKQARRIAEKGYFVISVDLYDGELPATIEEAHILERGLSSDRVLAHLKAGVDYLSGLPAVRKESIGIIGWDSGGGFALDAAMHDRRLKAAILCYGRVTTEPGRLALLEANVLAIFGGDDIGIPAETVEQFRKAMQKAGKSAAIHVYPDCGNSFMDPDSPFFEGKANPAAIADAWMKIEGTLGKALR